MSVRIIRLNGDVLDASPVADVEIEPQGTKVDDLPVLTVKWTDVATGTRMEMSDIALKFQAGRRPGVTVYLADGEEDGRQLGGQLGRIALWMERPEDFDTTLAVALVCEYVSDKTAVHVSTGGKDLDVVTNYVPSGITKDRINSHKKLCGGMYSRKAWFRATREVCGISQLDVADEADVRVLTVKRWERPDGPEPPEDVCRWLSEALSDHDAAVDEMCSGIMSSTGTVAVLDLYRTQEECDRAFGGTEGAGVPFGFRNAITRDAAERLRSAGLMVRWRYPGEGAGCSYDETDPRPAGIHGTFGPYKTVDEMFAALDEE